MCVSPERSRSASNLPRVSITDLRDSRSRFSSRPSANSVNLCIANRNKALAASQEDREKGKNEGISAARGLQAYWSCQLGEPVLDVFVAKFSRALGPGCVDIVVVGERTLFTLREQGTVRLQKVLGYQPACACKYTVAAAPGEEGSRLAGTTVREIDEGFAAVVEEENLIIGADTDQLMVYKVRENRSEDEAASSTADLPLVSLDGKRCAEYIGAA